MTLILRALALVALAAAVSAQGIPGDQFLTCECSGSDRGYRIGAFNDLQGDIENLVQKATDLNAERPRLSDVEIKRRLAEAALSHWTDCLNNYSAEECVNADTALRLGSCQPNCASICFYNRGTWKTIANGELNQDCDKITRFATIDQELIDRNPNNNPNIRASATNPRPGPKGNVPVTTATPSTNNNNSNNNANNNSNNSNNNANNNNPNNNPNSNSNSNGPTVTPTPGTKPASGSGNEIGGHEPPPTRRTAEGCVAVEHLKGYVLQHSHDLRRPVLCGRGFCATPNHAIIVDGEWTSMKRLCKSKWQCVRSVKMVNNLKLTANPRAVVNDFITVTAYDLRFPRWCIWLVQALEDAVNLIGFSVAIGGAAVVGVMVGAKVVNRA